MHLVMPAGILLPASVLSSELFAHFATFVAINTVIYGALSVAKILPKIYVTDWMSGSSRRSATRSIYPDAPLSAKPAARRSLFGSAKTSPAAELLTAELPTAELPATELPNTELPNERSDRG